MLLALSVWVFAAALVLWIWLSLGILNSVARKVKRIMAAQEDLQSAVSRLATSTDALVTAVEAFRTGSVPASVVADAAVAINATSDKLDAEKTAVGG